MTNPPVQASAKHVCVVGIGADGWSGLAPAARDAVTAADVLMGSQRQLDLVPSTVVAQRVSWPSPLVPALPRLLERHRGHTICVLASGDPMFFGIGATLVRLLGAAAVRVLPHASSVSLACARLGWPAQDVDVVSVVGRPLALVHPVVQQDRRLLVLSADGETPAALAALLRRRGFGPSEMTVLEQLGGARERLVGATAAEWREPATDPLNIVGVWCRREPGTPALSRLAGLPDDAFDHDGQITKREIRAITLGRLAPIPGELLWDVGAGAGSVAIEWMRCHPACDAIAVERHPERAERIARNAANLGVPTLRVVRGSAPDALGDLPSPAAVFVGGGATDEVLARCWQALRDGGRLVVNAVTVRTEALLAGWHARLGGELTRVSVSRTAPLGTVTGWRGMAPITQWAITKDEG